MRFHDTVRFSRRMKSKQRSRVLPRFHDVPSTYWVRRSLLASLFFLFYFIPLFFLYPTFTILRTPRVILFANAITVAVKKGWKDWRKERRLPQQTRQEKLYVLPVTLNYYSYTDRVNLGLL